MSSLSHIDYTCARSLPGNVSPMAKFGGCRNSDGLISMDESPITSHKYHVCLVKLLYIVKKEYV